MPLVALVGRTNVGKSTLFNRLTGTRQAVTAQEAGTTRDRSYGIINWQSHQLALVDTAGLIDSEDPLIELSSQQTNVALEEADVVLFVYDGREGISEKEKEFVNLLRKKHAVWLVANKIDTYNPTLDGTSDKLGLKHLAISAAHGRGVADLVEELTKAYPYKAEVVENTVPVIAIVGRPNVGKSSLLNTLLGKERSVVSELNGTTRDVVTDSLTIEDQEYLIADTAGIRRRGKIERGAEAFSVKRAIDIILKADLVLVVTDATAGTTRADLHLLYLARDLNKKVLLVLNKMDLMQQDSFMHRHAGRFDIAEISALKNENIKSITDWIKDNTN